MTEDRDHVLRPMARNTDPDTSHETAAVVRPELGKIQALVMKAYRAHGPMTARTCECLPEFDEYGFSTVRKRISELAAEGYLVASGVNRSRRSPATIYRVAARQGELF